MLLATEKDRNV